MHSLILPRWNTVIRWTELPGEGVPLLCLPGLSFAAIPSFLPLMTQPGFRGRRVLMLDYIGSGLSGHSSAFDNSLGAHVAAIEAVLATACSGPVDVLGHSMGGTVGIALARAYPARVDRLVAGEANLTPGGGAASRRIAGMTSEAFVTGHAARMARLAETGASGDAEAGFLWAARAGADPRAVHGNARTLVDLPPGLMEDFLTLPHARHFIYGALSHPAATGLVGADTPEPAVLNAAGVATHVVPDVGHMMMSDDPAAAAAVIAPLLRP